MTRKSNDNSLHHLDQQLPHMTAEGLLKYPAKSHMKTSFDVISSPLSPNAHRLNYRDTKVSHSNWRRNLKISEEAQIIWGNPVDQNPLISGRPVKERLVLRPGVQALFPGCRGRREEGSPACFMYYLHHLSTGRLKRLRFTKLSIRRSCCRLRKITYDIRGKSPNAHFGVT